MSSAIAFLLVLFAGTSHRIRADRRNPSGERIEDFIQKLICRERSGRAIFETRRPQETSARFGAHVHKPIQVLPGAPDKQGLATMQALLLSAIATRLLLAVANRPY